MTRIQAIVFTLLLCEAVNAAEPIDIGSRLELMIDDHLVASTSGGIHLQLHKPVRRNVALVTDRPWEGNACTYTSVFQDGKRFRMYFGSYHYVTTEGKLTEAHRPYTCYAESRDGIHWTRPQLGLVAFEGSKQNNIVWDGAGSHCFTPFKDTSPNCRPDARYKALSQVHRTGRPHYAAQGDVRP